MDDPDLTQLNIEISASDATEEDIDSMTRQLLSELRANYRSHFACMDSMPAYLCSRRVCDPAA